MFSLSLNPRPLRKIPASDFPERADVYACDKCGRDITKHLHPPGSHAWSCIGPERYQCACGQKYQTGAMEWERLGKRERRNRVLSTFVSGVSFSIASSVVGLLLYFGLRALGLRGLARIAALTIGVLPLALVQITFWPGVIDSMWRTRSRSIATSDQ